MIIVLEGPDCAGKTTMAHALIRASGDQAKYLHATRPERSQWNYCTGLISEALQYEADGYDVVIDRLWISDNVYSWIDTQSHMRAGINVRRQESVLHRYGAYYIMCCPDPIPLLKEYKQSYDKRGELYGARFDDILTIMQKYRDLWTGGHTQFEIDHPDQYTDQLSGVLPFSSRPLARLYDRFAVIDQERWARDVWEIAKIETRWFRECDPVRDLVDRNNLSGSLLTCKALLVGDRPSGEGPTRWPFYSDRGSSAYLTKALHRACIPETDVALVNAHGDASVHSVAALSACLEWLKAYNPRARVVALGHAAAGAIDSLDKEAHIQIPHPQWARRFNHNGQYHKLLEMAIYDSIGPVQARAETRRPVGVPTGIRTADDLRGGNCASRPEDQGAAELELDVPRSRALG